MRPNCKLWQRSLSCIEKEKKERRKNMDKHGYLYQHSHTPWGVAGTVGVLQLSTRVMLDHRWLPALNRARREETEKGDECRAMKGTNTEAGRPPEQEKHFSTSTNDGCITTSIPAPPPSSPSLPFKSREDLCELRGLLLFFLIRRKQQQNI